MSTEISNTFHQHLANHVKGDNLYKFEFNCLRQNIEMEVLASTSDGAFFCGFPNTWTSSVHNHWADGWNEILLLIISVLKMHFKIS